MSIIHNETNFVHHACGSLVLSLSTSTDFFCVYQCSRPIGNRFDLTLAQLWCQKQSFMHCLGSRLGLKTLERSCMQLFCISSRGLSGKGSQDRFCFSFGGWWGVLSENFAKFLQHIDHLLPFSTYYEHLNGKWKNGRDISRI